MSFGSFVVLTGTERVTIVAHSGAVPSPVVVIDRASGEISLSDVAPSDSELSGTPAVGLRGIVGIVRLLSGPYIIGITACDLVGTVCGQEIFKITATKLIKCGRSEDEKSRDEAIYVRMLQQILNVKSFYFTYSGTVLTLTAQQRETLTSQGKHMEPAWKTADERFFWNKHLLSFFIQHNLDSWIIPIMMGYIECVDCAVDGKSFQFVLISRRNHKRAGTRWNMRGIDEEGSVANNVETEQCIVYNNSIVASYVQTRGSIPLFWTQKPTLAYKPPPTLSRPLDAAMPACIKHFEEQMRLHGDQVCINLVDQKGKELILAQNYNAAVTKMANPKIKYVAFDFHKHGSKNLHLLMEQIKTEIDSFGYFLAPLSHGTVEQVQSGAFRTNCVDNLDRTNVVQSMIGFAVLQKQLTRLGIIPGVSLPTNSSFIPIFKNVWANNANALSTQYSGTCALKNDITRTGKRTLMGMKDDGMNSLTRYYLNNFSDGYTQDAYNLFLGLHQPRKGQESPFDTSSTFLIRMLLFILVAVVCLWVVPNNYSLTHRFLLTIVALLFVYFVAKKNRGKLVNVPRLPLNAKAKSL
ncbi:phosphatidylinositide phosphatase SAC1 [Pelomyxa schiedti]|nr:phosphatidylinositide phosphatase SAC1 [Pelomyxa schiedti]